jgi:uncharacterized membrane protein YqjE
MTDSEPGAHAGFGLFASLRRALADAIELVHTRLELVSIEFEAGVRHALGLVLWLMVALCSAALTVLLLVLTVLIAFWDTHRLLAAGAITAFFAALSVIAILIVRHRIRTRPRLLAATIGELRRDAAALDRSG